MISISSSTPVWFITGASSGFGRAVTEHVLQKGHIVIATLRNPSALNDIAPKFSSSQLLILKLDVSNKEDVAAAFERSREAFGRIDVVYSNAGYTAFCEVEDAQDELTRPLFETNFWGAVNVAQQALRFFRDVNRSPGGRLIQVSSFLSAAIIPTSAYYRASKAALEAVTESMSQELSESWNIKTTIVQPGLFPTKVISEKTASQPLSPQYGALGDPGRAFGGGLGTLTATNKSVAKYAAQIFTLSQLPEPPLRLALGDDALATMRAKISLLAKELDEYEAWSTDLDD